MINLPKPSPLSIKGNTSEQISYIIKYLQRLVAELEKMLGSIKEKKSAENAIWVSDISLSEGMLNVIFSDGSVKQINLEN